MRIDWVGLACEECEGNDSGRCLKSTFFAAKMRDIAFTMTDSIATAW